MKVIISKIREDAKIPYKKHINDAGYDLCWTPSNFSELQDNYELNGERFHSCIGILPQKSMIFETGLKVNFPSDFVLEIKNRSGMASKKNLVVGACVVDSTYTGEVFVDLHNLSDKIQIVEAGERIAQFVIYKVENCIFEEFSGEQYDKEIISARGSNGFGSSGKF